MTKNDGGFAFPFFDSSDPDLRPGMTLRDWFAGHVLASGCADAKWAYQLADAMIAEREAGDE